MIKEWSCAKFELSYASLGDNQIESHSTTVQSHTNSKNVCFMSHIKQTFLLQQYTIEA